MMARSSVQSGFRALAVLGVLSMGVVACGGESTDYAEAMKEEHASDVAVPSPAAEVEPGREVETLDVTYATIEGEPAIGFVARPVDAPEGSPGVLVIQEWWGLNDNIRAMAERLAGEGYIALAVDLYGGEVAEDREKAYELMSAALERMDQNLENLRLAHSYLTDELGAGSTGSVGWCFGGGMSLQAALTLGGDLDAAVIFYGKVETEPSTLQALEAPVLGLFAAEDQGIPVDSVREFERVLGELGKDAEIQIYDGVGHAFANPTGNNYDAPAAEDAWRRTLDFFGQQLAADAGE